MPQGLISNLKSPRMKMMLRWLPVLGAALLVLFLPLPLPAAAPRARLIRVEASTSGFSPAEIAVNPGDRVTVELVAMDVAHGLALDGYGFSLSAEPGQPGRGSFVADKAGLFRFRCAVPCGNLHPFVVGKLEVGPNTALWRAVGLGLLALGAAVWTLQSTWKRSGPAQAPAGREAA